MRSGHTAGAALDVYPSEPAANGDYFNDALNPWGNDLRSLKNLILTPHIGGSTEGRSSYTSARDKVFVQNRVYFAG